MRAVVLENIRSCYNVGSVVRVANFFGFDVIISGYTPSPLEKEQVQKTSLWAEENINIFHYYNPLKALYFAKQQYGRLIAAETENNAKEIANLSVEDNLLAVVLGNEKEWILRETLQKVDDVFYIHSIGDKSSLNVSQAATVFMYHIHYSGS